MHAIPKSFMRNAYGFVNDNAFAWVQKLFGEGDAVTADQLILGLPLSPEHRLAFAIFERVAADLRPQYRFAKNRDGKLIFFDAAWYVFFKPENPEWPYAFENLCDSLNIDPTCARKRFERLIFDTIDK